MTNILHNYFKNSHLRWSPWKDLMLWANPAEKDPLRNLFWYNLHIDCIWQGIFAYKEISAKPFGITTMIFMMRKKCYFGAFCAKLGPKTITFEGNTVIPIHRKYIDYNSMNFWLAKRILHTACKFYIGVWIFIGCYILQDF